MRPLDNIEKLIKKLRYKSSAETRDRVLGNVLQILDKSEKQKSAAIQPNIWRIIMKSKITKLAAAAAIIIAVLAGIYHFGGSIDGAGVAWAEVAEKVEKIQTFICRRIDNVVNAEEEQSVERETVMMMYTSSEYGSRIDSHMDGEVQLRTYTLPSEKAIITVIPAMKMYARHPLSKESIMEMERKGPREIVKRFMSVKYKELGREIIGGIEVEGIEVNDPKVVSANFPIESLVARLWVHVETELPVLVEVEIAAGGGAMQIKTVMDEFQWNVDLEASDFEPNIPSDYTLIEE